MDRDHPPAPTEPSAALIARARAGDRGAFDLLAEAHRAALCRYAAPRLGGDPDRAADAVQAALLEAWRDLPALRDPAALSGWLRRIVFKQCDRLRRAERPAAGLESVPEAADADAPEPGRALLEGEEAEARTAAVAAALAALPPGERDAVLLYYLGGCPLRDAAEFLGVSVAAAKSRLHAARRRLRDGDSNLERRTTTMTEQEYAERYGAGATAAAQLTAAERAAFLQEVQATFDAVLGAFNRLAPDALLALHTDDYVLIFPSHRGVPNWDRVRVEQDLRKGLQPPAPPFRLRAVLDDLLFVRHDPQTGALTEATVRDWFVREGAVSDAPGDAGLDPVPRIDTFRRAPEAAPTGWKLCRSLSLAPSPPAGKR